MTMTRKTVRILLGALATVAVAIFAVPASAVQYSSGFDPVAFSGTGLFQFDDTCLNTDGLHLAADCNLVLLNASLDMTDTGSSDTAHLDFAPVLPDSTDMVDLIISGGTLVGIDTGLIGPVFVTDDGSSLFGPWWLQWQSDPVFLFTGGCTVGVESEVCTPNEFSSGEATNVTFTRVPEPGTLGLILGGVGAAWVARRRKRAA
jgi:PEP-CTERM motif-containing protein